MSNYRHNEAGFHLVTAVPMVPGTMIAKDIISLLFSGNKNFETINYIYGVTDDGQLQSVVSIRELLQLSPTDTLQKSTPEKLITVRPHTDQERVAHLALTHTLKAIPVIDAQKKFLGVVPSDAILRILDHEHHEDLFRLSGVSGEVQQYKIQSGSPWYQFRVRLPWLLVGLVGGGFAALVVSRFEHVLAETVILAAFIPAVVYMADAVGSQTQTVFIRSLHTANINIWSILRRELITSVGIGAVIAFIAGTMLWYWQGSIAVSSIIAITFFITIIVTAFISVVLPYLFHKFAYDPAVASGPLATVIRDVSSLLLYFIIAQTVLSFWL